MLGEALTYLLTRCDRAPRRVGYLHETVALQARAKRCRRAWSHHVASCRAAIALATASCARRRRVVVLGSGPLTDVPVDTLEREFKNVDLVDIVQPRTVVRRFGHRAAVTLHQIDLTGTVTALTGCRRGDPLPPPHSDLPAIARASDVDLVVALNLSSQLAVLPVRYASTHLGVDDAMALDWARAIVRGHLRALASSIAPVCLITDVQANYRDHNGTTRLRDDLLYGQALPAPTFEWTWTVAPTSELRHGETVEHLVHAWPQLPKAELARLLEGEFAETEVASTVDEATRGTV